MDIIALVFLIAGKVANVKGLMTTSIVFSSICVLLNLIIFAIVKDDNDTTRTFKSLLGVIIGAALLTLSIIFRVGM